MSGEGTLKAVKQNYTEIPWDNHQITMRWLPALLISGEVKDSHKSYISESVARYMWWIF